MLTKIIGLAQIASQAKMEAEQARARARAADKQATENKAIAEHATEYADLREFVLTPVILETRTRVGEGFVLQWLTPECRARRGQIRGEM